MKRILFGVMAATLLFSQAPAAEATVYNITLSGSLANATTGTFTIGSDQ